MLQKGSAESNVAAEAQRLFGAPEGPAIPVAGFSRFTVPWVAAPASARESGS